MRLRRVPRSRVDHNQSLLTCWHGRYLIANKQHKHTCTPNTLMSVFPPFSARATQCTAKKTCQVYKQFIDSIFTYLRIIIILLLVFLPLLLFSIHSFLPGEGAGPDGIGVNQTQEHSAPACVGLALYQALAITLLVHGQCAVLGPWPEHLCRCAVSLLVAMPLLCGGRVQQSTPNNACCMLSQCAQARAATCSPLPGTVRAASAAILSQSGVPVFTWPRQAPLGSGRQAAAQTASSTTHGV